MDTNVLYYGDNLKILREHIPDDSIDLIYLDPPFNSNASYNVLFKEPTGKSSEAQITAFEDTWHWGIEAERTLLEINNSKLVSPKVKDLMSLLPSFLGRNDMMAYLVMMCIRLVELKRALKNAGSIYLHCDPTASHYLKILLDGIFGPNNFRNEIIWRRSNAHNKLSRQYGPIHDVLLFYSKTDKFTFHPPKRPHFKQYIEDLFRYSDSHGRYRINELTGSGIRHGESGESWRNYNPTSRGRHWAISAKLFGDLVIKDESTSQELLEILDKKGLIIHPKDPKGFPRYKQYLEDGDGVLFQDIWAYQPYTQGLLYNTQEGIDEDTKWLESGEERLDYPTQKPEGLLERILLSSSDEGDMILDPFCGCGTAVVTANKLNRKWIGIDITHLAIGVMKLRLYKMFPGIKYSVKGEPEDLEGAKELARQNKYEFQWWAVSKIGGQPYGDKKKGADTGIDGYLYFTDYSTDKNKVKKAIISVKAGGQVHSSMIRDLGHVIDREKAEFGIFITLEKPTEPMVKESATKGFYNAQSGHNYPRIQILTIEDIMQGKKPNIPMWVAPIQAPPVAVKVEGKTKRML